MVGYVYVIGNGRGFYKIGQTAGQVSDRLSSLQTGCPDELSIVHVQPAINPSRIERDLHLTFAEKRVRGEWFALDTEDLFQITQGEPATTGWGRLVQLEPRLGRLLERAKTEWRDEPSEYCAMRVWYGRPDWRHGLKAIVCDLVGWSGKRQGWHPELCTSLAYDIAYETVFEALPPCRGLCGCSA